MRLSWALRARSCIHCTKASRSGICKSLLPKNARRETCRSRSRVDRNWKRPFAVSFLSIQLQVPLPLTTIPPSGRNRFRSILIPANGWFSAHRRMRFMRWSPTGRSTAASISRGRSISAAPGLRAACRPRPCGRLSSSQRWKPAFRSVMMRTAAASRLWCKAGRCAVCMRKLCLAAFRQSTKFSLMYCKYCSRCVCRNSSV